MQDTKNILLHTKQNTEERISNATWLIKEQGCLIFEKDI